MQILLTQLKKGQRGHVAKIEAQGLIRHRLFDMGLTRGAEVEFIKKAPLGDPIEILLRGYNLTLRKSEASTVLVDIDDDTKAV